VLFEVLLQRYEILLQNDPLARVLCRYNLKLARAAGNLAI